MSQCESMQSSLDAVKEALKQLKPDEEKLKQWENDTDTDDILLNFVERIGIEDQHFEAATQEFSQNFNERINSSPTINIDYTIINDLHRLKHILKLASDKTYNLENIENLIEQLKDDGLHYLAELLEYINTEYFQDFDGRVSPSSNIKLVLFRKLLEATIPAMQSLHDTIRKRENLSKETKLYRVWRRSTQEKDIFGNISERNKITTDVFLSTSKNIEKVIEFYKNQCTESSEEVSIIWEISMGKDQIHPDSQIQDSGLDEVVLNTGSILQIAGDDEETITEHDLTYKLKKFVYIGHVTKRSDRSFYDKISYNDAIKKFKKEITSPSKKQKVAKGGKNTQRKKEIMGRTRCIYKKPNDHKEYVKYKGELVTLKEFKNIFKKKS